MLRTGIRSRIALAVTWLSRSIVSTVTCQMGKKSSHHRSFSGAWVFINWHLAACIKFCTLASLHNWIYFCKIFLLLLCSSFMYTLTCSWLNWLIDNLPTIKECFQKDNFINVIIVENSILHESHTHTYRLVIHIYTLITNVRQGIYVRYNNIDICKFR